MTPLPLPAAPASVNVRLVLSGREVQWTLRDSDEARLAERLTALLERYPVAQPPASPAPTADTARLCPPHGAAIQLNHKDGRSWWSHTTADGWCQGK